MSATVAAALKKIAVAILTDKKALKTVGGIILGILIIICLPVVSIVSILNGDIQFDEARLQQIVVQNLSAEEQIRLQAVEDTMYMSLSIQERLKDLRVERGLTLGQLAEQTGLSKSALGSYETEDFKDISHYALIRLAKFYGVTADYLLGLSEMKNHPNADLADLRLSDEMIDLLKSGRIDNTLLCELAAHPDFPRLMADLEIYVNGTALKQAQGANAIVDTMSATVIKNSRIFLSAAR